MGYYTRFNLEVQPEEYREVIIEEIKKLSDGRPGTPYGEYVASNLEPDWFGDSMKWYDWEKDMQKVAAVYPDALIILDGDGEEQGDLWRAFFKGIQFEMHRPPAWSPPLKPFWEDDCGC